MANTTLQKRSDESLVAPETEAARPSGLIPEIWSLAWEEFGKRYPRLKHGPAILAFSLFTFLGLSVVGLISYFYVFLPWFVWALMFLSTTVLAQMFISRFSTLAYQRISRETSEAFNRILNAEQSRAKLLQSQLDKKNKQDLSIKQERVWLEKTLMSGESGLVYWDVTISLYITNHHEADNAIRGYGLMVALPNGQELEGEIGSATRLVSRRTGEELIDLKTSLDVPLKRGHPKKGAVRFRFSSNDLDLNLAGMDYVLRIQDVYDVAHKPKGKLPEPGDDLHWKLPDKAYGG